MNSGYAIAFIISVIVGLGEPMLFVPCLILCCIVAAINNATAG